MKTVLFALLSSVAINAVALETKEIAIPAVCTESKDFYEALGDYRVLMEYKDKTSTGASLSDFMIASKTKSTVFVIRENHEVGGVCVLSIFEVENRNKATKPSKAL